jgi:hypothetical protein
VEHGCPDSGERRGSAAVAKRRLSHPGGDGGGAVPEEVDPASEITSEVTRRLSELLAVIADRTVVPNGNASPRPTESVVPAAPKLQDDDTGMATISLRLDTWLLARIDADAKPGFTHRGAASCSITYRVRARSGMAASRAEERQLRTSINV